MKGEKQMYVKKLRRKCGVRGCRNLESYTLSLRSESGNSVIICRDCLEAALKAIDKYEKDAPKVKKSTAKDTPLFYHPELIKDSNPGAPKGRANTVSDAVKDATGEGKGISDNKVVNEDGAEGEGKSAGDEAEKTGNAPEKSTKKKSTAKK